MIEIFALVLSVAGVLWTRKQDIALSLKDPNSRGMIAKAIQSPPRTYQTYLEQALNFANQRLEKGARCYFSIVFITFMYSSLLFMVAWSYNGINSFTISSNSQFSSVDEKFRISVLFVSIILFFICYFLSKNGGYAEKFIIKSINKNKTQRHSILVRIFISLFIFVLMNEISGSYIYASIITLSSVFASFSIMKISDSYFKRVGRINVEAIRVGLASGYGPTALLVVVFCLIVDKSDISLSIALAAVIGFFLFSSTFLGWYGFKQSDGNLPDAPTLARAPIVMGAYIKEHYVGFSISVMIAAIFPIILREMGGGSFSVTLSAFLTCAIFLAGATSLGGAGFVVFIIIIITTCTLFAIDRSAFSSKWIVTLLFWGVLPVMNSIFDFITWNVSKFFAENIIKGNSKSSVFWICLDFIILLVVLIVFTACITFSLYLVDDIYVNQTGYHLIDINYLLHSLQNNALGDSFWITAMIVSVAVPTVMHIVFFILNGLGDIVPKAARTYLVSEINKLPETPAAHDIERLSWSIAFIDNVFGIFVFAIFVLFSSLLFFDFAISFGQFLLYVSHGIVS